jgi:hypothetical protein
MRWFERWSLFSLTGPTFLPALRCFEGPAANLTLMASDAPKPEPLIQAASAIVSLKDSVFSC